MPSLKPLPTVEDLRQAFHNAVRGIKDGEADNHAGSSYDHFAGVGAILWSWQAQRDQDLFESIYFDRATGQELTDYVDAHDGIDRFVDAYGVGTIIVNRSSTAGGAGTFWKGTRVQIFVNHGSNEYEITSSVTVSSTDKTAVIPIRATFTGRNSKYSLYAPEPVAQFMDPLWDNNWVVNGIDCGEGTSFEQAPEYRARVRIERKKRRVGYQDVILNLCKTVGAENVFLLQSNFAGEANDHGINVAYVGDSGYTTTDDLRYRTLIALEDIRVLGADLLVLPMQLSQLSFYLTLNLWDEPSKLNAYEIKRSASASVLNYFASSSGFSYDLNTIAGNIRKLMPDVVQSVTFASPTSSQGILVSGAFPGTLTKYEVQPGNISVSLNGPS